MFQRCSSLFYHHLNVSCPLLHKVPSSANFTFLDSKIIEDSENITMLMVPRPFMVSKRLRKIGTVRNFHELSDDVMITLQRKSKFQTWYVA